MAGEEGTLVTLTPELVRIRDEAREAALDFGLDFPEVVFELVDSDELMFCI